MAPVRVLLVDDRTPFRQGLDSLLNEDQGLELVGQAADGADAVHKCRQMAPDVVLMGLKLPEQAGITATQQIREMFQCTKVVVLATSERDDYLIDALRAGCSGYSLKTATIEKRALAVKLAARDESITSPYMATRPLEESRNLKHHAWQVHGNENLTRREREVLSLLAKGVSGRDIAAALNIPETMVNSHTHRILEKLALSSCSEAAAFVARLKDTGLRAVDHLQNKRPDQPRRDNQ